MHPLRGYQGRIYAQYELVSLNYRGKDYKHNLSKDKKEAFYCLQLVVVQGNINSQYYWGNLYSCAEWVDKYDGFVAAHLWYSTEAVNGHE